jgi:hypothetical protein
MAQEIMKKGTMVVETTGVTEMVEAEISKEGEEVKNNVIK